MDSPRSVQPISGSIPSKQVSNVFLAQVTASTKSTPPVHVSMFHSDHLSNCQCSFPHYVLGPNDLLRANRYVNGSPV